MNNLTEDEYNDMKRKYLYEGLAEFIEYKRYNEEFYNIFKKEIDDYIDAFIDLQNKLEKFFQI